MRMTASPSSRTLTRQSTRASPFGGDFDGFASARLREHCQRRPCDAVRATAKRISAALSRRAIAAEIQCDLDALLGLQVVMHDGREHDLVGLDEKPRGLHADDEILAGDDVGLKPWPTRVPWPMPQTLIRQVVRFSGMSSETSAVPSAAVVSLPTQRAVSANFVRSVG